MRFQIEEQPKDEHIKKGLLELSKDCLKYEEWIKEWKEYGWLDPDQKHKEMFKAYVDRIAKTYPPGKYIYVGIGASCDLVFESLALRHKAHTVSIPISAANISPQDISKEQEEWTSEQLKHLQTYVMKTVGKDAIDDTGKNLLVMDVTSGGGSLKIIADTLEAVLLALNKGPERVQRLSLNRTVLSEARIKTPKESPPTSEPPLQEEAMMERPLTKEELQSGVIRKGIKWDPFLIFEEEDLSDEEQEKEKPQKFEYEPVEYDFFVKRIESQIGTNLDNMMYKKLGRIYEKIPMKDVMTGKIASPEKHYNKRGHEAIKHYAEKLMAE